MCPFLAVSSTRQFKGFKGLFWLKFEVGTALELISTWGYSLALLWHINSMFLDCYMAP
jgi:hypothetical protein